ncbi:hypothetical protein GLYMA_18G207000v4 [Glycine max]|nr:hypothetical protein GLYMA_18G207000v4 [Glycine max]
MLFRMSRSGRWIDVNPELEHLLANAPKPEEQMEWKELARKIQDTTAPPEAIFMTASARDQIFEEVGKIYAIKFKDVRGSLWHLVDRDDTYHTIVYNQDLDQPDIVAGWTTLCQFYPLIEDHLVLLQHYGLVTFKVFLTKKKISCSSLDVPSAMYYFLKDKGWYNLHLENIAECRLVFNHYRKSLKIGARWKQLCETLSLAAGTKIVFEFINPRINRVLYWLYL